MTSPDEELLAELLLLWEELRDRGQDTPAAELAADRADLVAELDRRIQALKEIAWLDEPIDHAPAAAAEPARPRQPPPRTLAGRYRLDELISEGGFAQVFRAYDAGLQRTVAVKIPKPDRHQSPEAIQAEARRVARLKHDGIVPVFDVGLDGDTCYIVTEYVEGGSLADRLAGPRPDTQQTISWVADVADALEYAHLHGVVHRDIKPANILIDHHGRAKLTDFGISQAATRAGTTAAASLGTLWYMSPEQLTSDATDHRSDIYSLAIVLHEALAGSPPYRSWEPARLRTEILEGTVTVATGIRSRLRPILRQALSRSPHHRHASASHFAAEIRRAGSCSARRWPWPWWGIALTAVAGAAAGASGLRLLQPHTPAVPRSAEAFREVMAKATTQFFHGQFEDAEASFTSALRAFPRNHQALADRGVCRMKLGRMDEALEDFTAALVQAPHDHETLRNRAQAAVHLRRYDEAIADLQIVAEHFPALSEIPQELATAHALRAGDRLQNNDVQGAIADLTQALGFKPDMVAYFEKRAACFARVGDLDRAVVDWTEAIKRQSRSPALYAARAACLRRLGRDGDADADLLTARRLAAETENEVHDPPEAAPPRKATP